MRVNLSHSRVGLVEAKGENGEDADHLNVSMSVSEVFFKGPGQDGRLSAACKNGARKQPGSALNAEVADHGDISHLKTNEKPPTDTRRLTSPCGTAKERMKEEHHVDGPFRQHEQVSDATDSLPTWSQASSYIR